MLLMMSHVYNLFGEADNDKRNDTNANRQKVKFNATQQKNKVIHPTDTDWQEIHICNDCDPARYSQSETYQKNKYIAQLFHPYVLFIACPLLILCR